MTPQSWYDHAREAIARERLTERAAFEEFIAPYDEAGNESPCHETDWACGDCMKNGCKHHLPAKR